MKGDSYSTPLPPTTAKKCQKFYFFQAIATANKFSKFEFGKYQKTKLKYSPESSLANFAIHTFGKLGKLSAVMAIFLSVASLGGFFDV